MSDMMTVSYFTITGMNHYFGKEFLSPGMKVDLFKDPENKYDHEAICVKLPVLGKIGYVANSPATVLGESMSAGRLYDRMGDAAQGTVIYVLNGGAICRLDR